MLAGYLQGLTQLRNMSGTQTPADWKFSCIEEAVLVEGRPFGSEPVSESDKQEILAALFDVKARYRQLGKIKECFSNSFMVAAHNSDFQYVEGYAHGFIPFHHAWNLWRGRVLVDTTLRIGDTVAPDGKVKPRKKNFGDAIIGEIPDKYEFYGVPFTEKEFAAAAVVTKQQGGFLDCWKKNFPFLREGMDAFRLERERL